MLLYLDMCSLQRPLDDKAQPRIALEAEAVLGILALCPSAEVQLLSSDPLEYETAHNPHPLRKAHAEEVLARAVQVIRLSDEIEQRAKAYNKAGLKPLDALHLACAVQAGADYFCTCDDQLLRRARSVHGGSPRVVTPVELIEEIGS
ncbi:MAG TPA: PIN domain-containing protein [Gemmataceae bacterium]|nr:PIN domain-containing protein [Gemmataceae bacterium]